MTTKPDDSTVPLKTAFNYIFSGVTALLVAIQTWEIKEIVDIEAKISLIQGSMMKASDGLDIGKAIADIMRDVAILPTQAPPKWFVERVEKQEQKMDSLSVKLDANFSKMDYVRVQMEQHLKNSMNNK